MDLSLGLENQHVLITGSSGFIGSQTVLAFLSAGANVTALDIKPFTSEQVLAFPSLPKKFRFYICDITSESEINTCFAEANNSSFGVVKICIALASLDWSVLEHHESLVDMSVEQWRRTQQVNIEGTFLTARAWLRGLKEFRGKDPKIEGGANLVIIGSESGRFGVRGNADYAAGKSAVQVGLLRSLVDDVEGIWPGGRVNAVAPGAVDTPQFRKECAEDKNQFWQQTQATVASRKPVPIEAVAKSILFLASEKWSGSVNGQVLNVDSGKMGKMMWMKEDCE